MGWVLMSERDVRRIEVLTEILSGRRTVASAAIVLAISVRQVHRLLIRFREDGGGALIHKGRGQASNHRLTPGVREYALELVRTRYADFGPTLAIEVLLDKHGLKVGREFKNYVDEEAKRKNTTKSKVRAKVEQVFRILKRIFGFDRVRYRGIAKNHHRLCANFAPDQSLPASQTPGRTGGVVRPVASETGLLTVQIKLRFHPTPPNHPIFNAGSPSPRNQTPAQTLLK
jgi:hypothetical protein